MTKRPDAHLWEAYDKAIEANEDAVAAKIAASIVEFHGGFIYKYAVDTAFPQWTKDQVKEYYHELIVIAMEKLPSYDRDRVSTNGLTSSFINYLKPHLKAARWKTATEQDLIKHGVETRRLKADLERYLEQQQQMDHSPSVEEMAEYLTTLHGKHAKPIREGQVRRLLDQPKVMWADAAVTEEEGASHWDIIPAIEESVETQVIQSDETEERSKAVLEALTAAGLSDIERCIVAERLMMAPRRIVDGVIISPGPTTLTALGDRFGLKPEAVRRCEQQLVERLRGLIQL